MDYNNNSNNISNQYLQQPVQQPMQQPVQGQYVQQPYQGQYMTPQMQMEMAQKQEADKKAAGLCIASIICTVLGYASYGILSGISDFLGEYASGFIVSLGGLLQLAGFVFMIIARVKYPKNTFAKVLMWIYIIGIIVTVLIVVLVLASCYYILMQCAGY